jgi:hypothetical protein
MYVCQTPVAAVKIAMPNIPSTVSVNTLLSSWEMPTSSACLSRNGLSIDTPAEITISTSTAVSRIR